MISDPEVIRRKQLAGGRRSSMSSMSGMSGMSGRDSPGVMSRSKSSTSVTSSYYDHAADDTYDACNAGERMERDVPQPQPPLRSSIRRNAAARCWRLPARSRCLATTRLTTQPQARKQNALPTARPCAGRRPAATRRTILTPTMACTTTVAFSTAMMPAKRLLTGQSRCPDRMCSLTRECVLLLENVFSYM